ncbi:hypothetical protein [Bacillus sp. T33-2]|uniref:hypothetical protein n=1 Tax=Bacillus sp. T33-2 TaxID=2054168 RepID=UPI001C60DFBF|nr:hypothetical protein [Bacillus sp. T33-2]
MNIRILHCGKSIENYNICINEKVIGFSKRVAHTGDLIYLVVRNEKVAYCGARAIVGEATDYKPWDNSELYVQAFNIENVEYCDPFDISILSTVGGKSWGIKYTQASKAIKDTRATMLLNDEFTKNISNAFHSFLNEVNIEESEEIDSPEIQDSDELDIMGTFLTVKFHSEQHKARGLETLVNRNFYNLFEEFKPENTILITDNRKFSTSTIPDEVTNKNINGISGIPDALLISFNKSRKIPLQINLVEYECYGEKRLKPMDKFNYLNGHIIPQLMRFASAFSVVTDTRIRESTVKSWADKIMNDFVYEDNDISTKVSRWIKTIHPNINEQKISYEFSKMLLDAFNSQLRIMLIIDELTSEQKETIKNVINSFKLGSQESIQFLGYVVRLEQRINIVDSNAEYALSIQK